MSKKKDTGKKQSPSPAQEETGLTPGQIAGPFKKGEVKNLGGGKMQAKFTFSLKDALLVKLHLIANNLSNGLSEEERTELKKAHTVLYQGLVSLSIRDVKMTGAQIDYSVVEGQEKAVGEILNNGLVYSVVLHLLEGKFGPFEEEKPTTFLTGGFFIDQILNGAKTRGGKQPNVFPQLSPQTQRQIMRETPKGHEGKIKATLKEGIDLDSSELKIAIAIAGLLHDKSQNTTDKKRPDYYLGVSEELLAEQGIGGNMVPYGGSMVKAPVLMFGITELARKYSGKDRPSGKDVKTVRGILERIEAKRYLVRYEKKRTEKGKTTILYIEGWESLVKILTIGEEVQTEDGKKKSREEVVVQLSPIFRDNIESKFIPLPRDLLSRVEKAYGSARLPSSVTQLLLYLQREIASKRYKPQIAVRKLDRSYIASDNDIQKSRWKKVASNREQAIETCKKVGLIEKVEQDTAKDGEAKLIFHLNKDWIDTK